METKSILKGAGVLLIAAIMILSTVAVTADTTKNEICLSNEPATTEICQPEIPGATGIVLWDQYDTDGSNGLSIADRSVFGFQRALLDDFEITDPEGWIINDFHMLGLWNTLTPPQGTGWVLEFWSDATGGVPGAPIVSTVPISYTETATGRSWFGRPEFEVVYTFEDVVLQQGIYWIWGYIIGPENCFWMARQDVIWRSECWCDYEDNPPLQPGSGIFGDPYDLAFQLTYDEAPPPVPDLDCEGDLDWVDVEPGAIVTGNFTVENIGDPLSLLDWEIESYPEDWGEWDFSDESGTGLTPEDGPFEIEVEVVAPDEEETEFTGEIVLANSNDPDDTCTIDVSLVTPVSQQSLFLQFLEMLAGHFPIIARILAVLF